MSYATEARALLERCHKALEWLGDHAQLRLHLAEFLSRQAPAEFAPYPAGHAQVTHHGNVGWGALVSAKIGGCPKGCNAGVNFTFGGLPPRTYRCMACSTSWND